MRNLFIALALLISQVSLAAPQTHLLLVGGGKRPVEAMKVLSTWAGGSRGTVMIIGWASEIPQDYYDTISADLRAQGVQNFTSSLTAPTTEAEKQIFLTNLRNATGVFFSGGNQNRAMGVVDHWELLNAITAKYLNGTPFAGTSAGCAMMAEHMITGNEGAMIGKGLGLLKKAILDMHFLHRKTDLRSREPRLLAAMNDYHVDFGIGVDEDGSVAIINSTEAKVLGGQPVVFFHRQADGSIVRNQLINQETFNLDVWHPAPSCPWSIAEAP